MISLLLLCHDASGAAANTALLRERVARSLASLVEGCVVGVIADASLLGPRHVDLEDIADEAGCHVFADDSPRDGLRRALETARLADVFLLAAGFALDRGFFEEARDAASFGGLKRPRVLRAAPDTLLTRLNPSLARPVGLLARKETIVAADSAEIALLARRLKAADLAAVARRTL